MTMDLYAEFQSHGLSPQRIQQLKEEINNAAPAAQKFFSFMVDGKEIRVDITVIS